MKIKKFCVNNVQEGMNQIKKEMGPDAVIIGSRKVREKGFRGLFAPVKVEITAAVDSPLNQEACSLTDSLHEYKLERELSELKHMVNHLVSCQQKKNIEEKGPFYRWMQHLIENDVDSLLAQEIMTSIHENFAADNALSDEVIELILLKQLSERIITGEVP